MRNSGAPAPCPTTPGTRQSATAELLRRIGRRLGTWLPGNLADASLAERTHRVTTDLADALEQRAAACRREYAARHAHRDAS